MADQQTWQEVSSDGLVLICKDQSATDVEFLELKIVGCTETVEAHPPQTKLSKLRPIVAPFSLKPIRRKESNSGQQQGDCQNEISSQL